MEIICTQFKICIKLIHFCRSYYCNGKPERGQRGGLSQTFVIFLKTFFLNSKTFCRLHSLANDLRFGLNLKEF